ncbi:MAG: hemerythrin domain-containing protein [Armatimonadia bacterium]
MRIRYILITVVALSLLAGQAFADYTCSQCGKVKHTATCPTQTMMLCPTASSVCPFSLTIVEPTSAGDSGASCGYSVRGAGSSFFTALKQDHHEILKQMDMISKQPCASAESWASLKTVLLPHVKAEETAFYPTLMQIAQTQQQAAIRVQEHAAAAAIIANLDAMPVTDCRWMPSFAVLRRVVSQHIADEQHDTFPMARAALAEIPFCSIYTNYAMERQSVLTGMSSEITNNASTSK